eukprot:jgi/Botrbrau1/567/Bobra.0010s0034.2
MLPFCSRPTAPDSTREFCGYAHRHGSWEHSRLHCFEKPLHRWLNSSFRRPRLTGSVRKTICPSLPGYVVCQAGLPEVCALDVEFAHYELISENGYPQRVQIAVEACVVNRDGTIFRSTFSPDVPEGARWIGGVRPERFEKLRRKRFLSKLRAILNGKVVVGHGLMADLRKLGLEHPQALCRDTITYPVFQGSGGSGIALRTLAKNLLGRSIQKKGRPHDPEEDARSVLELYCRYIVGNPQYMTDDELLEYHLAQLKHPGQNRLQ